MWSLMVTGYYQHGLTMTTMKKRSFHRNRGEVSNIFWTVLESIYSPAYMQIFHNFQVCSDWLYSAITHSPIISSLAGQIRPRAIVTLIALEYLKCKKILYPTYEAEMVGQSQLTQSIHSQNTLCSCCVAARERLKESWGQSLLTPLEDDHDFFLAQLLPN